MDSFAIDLDKVLDDFEESEDPATTDRWHAPQPPGDSHVLYGPPLTGISSRPDQLPYQLPEALDINDADFAPSMHPPILQKGEQVGKVSSPDVYHAEPELVQSTSNTYTRPLYSTSALHGFQPDVVPTGSYSNSTLNHGVQNNSTLANGQYSNNMSTVASSPQTGSLPDHVAQTAAGKATIDLYSNACYASSNTANQTASQHDDIEHPIGEHAPFELTRPPPLLSASDSSAISNISVINQTSSREPNNADAADSQGMFIPINEQWQVQSSINPAIGENELRDFLRGKHGPHVYVTEDSGRCCSLGTDDGETDSQAKGLRTDRQPGLVSEASPFTGSYPNGLTSDSISPCHSISGNVTQDTTNIDTKDVVKGSDTPNSTAPSDPDLVTASNHMRPSRDLTEDLSMSLLPVSLHKPTGASSLLASNLTDKVAPHTYPEPAVDTCNDAVVDMTAQQLTIDHPSDGNVSSVHANPEDCLLTSSSQSQPFTGDLTHEDPAHWDQTNLDSKQDHTNEDQPHQDRTHQDPLNQDSTHSDPSHQDPTPKDLPHQDPTPKDLPHQDPTPKDLPHQDPTHQNQPDKDPTIKDPPHQDPTPENPPFQDPTLVDSPHQDPTLVDSPHQDPTHVDSPHQDPTHMDSPHQDPTHMDSPHQDPTHMDSPHQDPTHMDSPHQDPTHLELLNQDPAREDTPPLNPAHKDYINKDPAQLDPTCQDPSHLSTIHQDIIARDPTIQMPTFEDPTHQDQANPLCQAKPELQACTLFEPQSPQNNVEMDMSSDLSLSCQPASVLLPSTNELSLLDASSNSTMEPSDIDLQLSVNHVGSPENHDVVLGIHSQDDIMLDTEYLASTQELDVSNVLDYILDEKSQPSETGEQPGLDAAAFKATDLVVEDIQGESQTVIEANDEKTRTDVEEGFTERRGSDESVERFLVQHITSPNISTPMEDAGMSRVPGFLPALPATEEARESDQVNADHNDFIMASNTNALTIQSGESSASSTESLSHKQPDVKPKVLPAASGVMPRSRQPRPNSLLGLSTPDLTPSMASLQQDMAAPHIIPSPTEAAIEHTPGNMTPSVPVASLHDDPNIPVSAALPGPGGRPTSLNVMPASERGRQAVMRSGEDIGSIDSSESSLGIQTPAEQTPAHLIAGQVESVQPTPPPRSSNLNVAITMLGKVAPVWVPDTEAANCMQCETKFTFTKRRHHCRACGKVFCSSCCNLKCRLPHLDNKEARVCSKCYQDLIRAQVFERMHAGSIEASPNPNQPSEYCSTIPPQQQASNLPPPTVVVPPSSALRKQGSLRHGDRKTVMFSDGIRPGGDLTEPGNITEVPAPRPTTRNVKIVEQHKTRTVKAEATETGRDVCLIPAEGLPPVRHPSAASSDYSLEENPSVEAVLKQIKTCEDPVVFALSKNLFVMVKQVHLDCCVTYTCWVYVTTGMCVVNQAEIVIVLKCDDEEEPSLQTDIFHHLYSVYLEAGKGNTVTTLGHSLVMQPFLGSRELGGFLYITPSFQCLQKIMLPPEPYLFGILLQKWEVPWAKVFPLRLMLRLGAEFRYYPCPLFSVRTRKPVYGEIGHTIMNLLADFRNYQYVLPSVRGMSIHMEDKHTYIHFPRNRYDEVMKVVNNSNEHVMSLGSNFSGQADSHLVCLQNDEGNYQTQAINIQNKARQVTGASFVVFNGALKSTSGLRAKSSIVEDGLMVQINAESLAALKAALRDMRDYEVECGTLDVAVPEEYVSVKWVDDDKNFNTGLKSPVDNMAMDGIESVNIHNSPDYSGGKRAIRWNQVFFILNETNSRFEPVDQSRLADMLAQACSVALVSHLDALKELGMTRIGLRTTIHAENVGYEAGSNGKRLPDFCMNNLDTEMIPVIHGAASSASDSAVTLELVFHIIE